MQIFFYQTNKNQRTKGRVKWLMVMAWPNGAIGHVGVIIMKIKQARQAVICGVIIRIALALFLSTYECVYEQQMVFTDIDYKVYSDAALYPSPYDRHTYRYSPLLAYLNAANYSLHEATGKLLLSLFDGVAMVMLFLLVSRSDSGKHALLVLKMYAYNPLFIALTVRGSCQSITLALMYAFWYCYFGGQANGNQSGLQAITHKVTVRQPDWRLRWLSYFLYGFWVHFRVYPIVLLPLLLAHEYQRAGGWKAVGKLVAEMGVGAGGVFLGLAALFYCVYGWPFLEETYLYHLTRRDNRHSFSPLFYELYLTYSQQAGSVSRAFIRLIPTLYIIASSLRFVRGYSPLYLHFLVTFAFVGFNKVITLQYYMWVLGALLPALSESIIISQGRLRMGWGLLLQWALPIMVWIWLSLRLENDGENHLHTMWMICLFQLYMHLWVLISLMKTIKPYHPLEERKKKLEEAKRILSGKSA